jgi:predicted nucleic acid-binding protein
LALPAGMKRVLSCAPIVTDKVVDASALVALLFDEPSQTAVVQALTGARLFAPALLETEVANACLKKIRARPAERGALLEAFALFSSLSITPGEVDVAETLALAERTKLTVYDASYLWLARALGAELVTLDERLAKADVTTRKA